MPIIITTLQDKIALKISRSMDFDKDRAKLDPIKPKRWDSSYGYWLLDFPSLGRILSTWKEEEIITQGTEIKSLIDKLETDRQPLKFLPKIEGKLPESPIKLKDFQETYVRIYKNKNRLLLSLDQGLGKTITALERCRILGYKRILVICPKVVCVNWRSEIRKCLEKQAQIFLGNKSQRDKLNKTINDFDIVITTYEQIGNLDSYDFDQIIIDEGHLLSNKKSKRFKDTHSFLDKILNRDYGLQILTGTPIQHKVRDLWAIIYLLNPNLAGSEYDWQNEYERVLRKITKTIVLKNKQGNPIIKDGKPLTKVIEIPIEVENKNIDKLKDKLSSIMYRVSREGKVSFKDSIENVIVEMTSKQQKLYERVRNDILVDLENKTLNLQNAPTRLLRLLQASEGYFNLDKDIIDSGKLDYVIDILQNTDEKIVVWSRFQPITEILGKMFKDKAVIYNGNKSDNYKTLAKWSFNGVDSTHDEEEFFRLKKSVKDFIFVPGEAQFLFGVINNRSSLGMNLHKHCNRQIFTSIDYMPTADFQAADRIRRLDQLEDTVYTQFILSENSVDSKVLNLALSNYNNSVNILDGKESITYKQIYRLLEELR